MSVVKPMSLSKKITILLFSLVSFGVAIYIGIHVLTLWQYDHTAVVYQLCRRSYCHFREFHFKEPALLALYFAGLHVITLLVFPPIILLTVLFLKIKVRKNPGYHAPKIIFWLIGAGLLAFFVWIMSQEFYVLAHLL